MVNSKVPQASISNWHTHGYEKQIYDTYTISCSVISPINLAKKMKVYRRILLCAIRGWVKLHGHAWLRSCHRSAATARTTASERTWLPNSVMWQPSSVRHLSYPLAKMVAWRSFTGMPAASTISRAAAA